MENEIKTPLKKDIYVIQKNIQTIRNRNVKMRNKLIFKLLTIIFLYFSALYLIVFCSNKKI